MLNITAPFFFDIYNSLKLRNHDKEKKNLPGGA